MHKIRNIKWLPVLMVLTIMAIAAFQFYWLKKAYQREERTLEMRTNFMFRETVFALQGSKLKLDKIVGDSAAPTRVVIQQDRPRRPIKMRTGSDPKVINMVDILTKRVKDSSGKALIIRGSDTMRFSNKSFSGRRNRLMQFLFDVDSVQDSVKVKELQLAYGKKLQEQNITVPFTIK